VSYKVQPYLRRQAPPRTDCVYQQWNKNIFK